jgi:thiamine phosphate synthase YjbQ (UPF0047 family)
MRPFGVHRQANLRVNLHLKAASASSVSSSMSYKYLQIEKETGPGISIIDVTPDIKREIEALNIREGTVHVLSRHTTTAVTINESEPRLMNDIKQVCTRSMWS